MNPSELVKEWSYRASVRSDILGDEANKAREMIYNVCANDLGEALNEVEAAFAETRKQVQAAVDASPRSVTFEQAKKQVERFNQSK